MRQLGLNVIKQQTGEFDLVTVIKLIFMHNMAFVILKKYFTLHCVCFGGKIDSKEGNVIHAQEQVVLLFTARLWYIELPVLTNNGKWPGYNQSK